MRTLYDETVDRLVGIGLESFAAKELVNELVRVELKEVRIETWTVSLYELRNRTQLITGVWMRLELIAVDWFDMEAPTHPVRELFIRKPRTMVMR